MKPLLKKIFLLSLAIIGSNVIAFCNNALPLKEASSSQNASFNKGFNQQSNVISYEKNDFKVDFTDDIFDNDDDQDEHENIRSNKTLKNNLYYFQLKSLPLLDLVNDYIRLTNQYKALAFVNSCKYILYQSFLI